MAEWEKILKQINTNQWKRCSTTEKTKKYFTKVYTQMIYKPVLQFVIPQEDMSVYLSIYIFKEEFYF